MLEWKLILPTFAGKYQIEIANKYLEKCGDLLPRELSVIKKLKSVTRFTNANLLEKIENLEEKKARLSLLADSMLAKFIVQLSAYTPWFKKAISLVSQLDCLISLAKASSTSGFQNMCRPSFIRQDSEPGEEASCCVDIKDLIHPFLGTSNDAETIPNDISLGGSSARGILLTGPNMGGKSTLLRQVCLAVIMAQVGCYVPATSCRLTVVDRIFTRIGANDNILQGESTFMVELQETSQILHYATPRSLVILDELGRGTATFDGTAIAHSVLHHLIHKVKCLLLFATHYHLLVDDWKHDKGVGLFHMSCFEDEEDNTITFLYKAVEGVCPSSHGMNVARMANIPEQIVEKAGRISQEFERHFKALQCGSVMIQALKKKTITPELLKVWANLRSNTSAY